MKKLLVTTLVFFSINIHANNSNTLLEWTTKNTIETFNYNAINFKEKLSGLKPKFTNEGWQRYKQALVTSGNIDYVVEHNLIVTGRLNGTPTINPLTANKWEITIPAVVTYLNEYATVTQDITAHVTVEQIDNKYAIADINSALNKPITVSKKALAVPKSCQIA